MVGCLLAGGLAAAAHAASGEPASADRGRLLYENHCITCHTAKVHRRIPQLPLTVQELRQIVTYWAHAEKVQWSEQDITDVAEYLLRNYYRDLPR
jgi:mono/diheme cytochrome c family protein